MTEHNIPLKDALQKHNNLMPISFHVPGHKNGLLWDEKEIFFNKNIGNIDVTELTGLDNLHYESGAIFEAEKLLAKCYKAKNSFFLVNGTTSGILAMIMATVKCGEKVLLQRQVHQSVLNALELVDAMPIFIGTEICYGIESCDLDIEQILQAINNNRDCKVLILTYPSYYGQTYNIAKVIEQAHEKGLIVLVDEAHGAHFIVGKPFPSSSLELGADVVVQSAHKTLPALTMGSFLHINSHLIKVECVKKYLRILQTSSPSYPIMLSLDVARNYIENFFIADVNYTLLSINKFCAGIKKLSGLRAWRSSDPLKVHLSSDYCDGYTLQNYLETVGVFPELADMQGVLLILPLLKHNFYYPFAEALERIESIANVLKHNEQVRFIDIDQSVRYVCKSSTLVYRFAEMNNLTWQGVRLGEAVGRVSSETIIVYPPGIPLLLRGELITTEIVEIINNYVIKGVKLHYSIALGDGLIGVFV